MVGFKKLLFILIPVVYFLSLSALLDGWSHLSFSFYQVFAEIPVVLIIYYFLYQSQPATRRFYLRFLIAVLPVTIFYLVYDYYYIVFNHTFRIAEIYNLSELIQVANVWQLLLLSCTLLLPLLVVVLSVDRKRVSYLYGVAGYLLIIFAVVHYVPKLYIKWIQTSYVSTFDEHTALKNNGRIVSTLYFEAKRQEAILRLRSASTILNDERITSESSKIKHTPDIYIIALESYLQPVDFKQKYSTLPLNKEWVEKFPNGLKHSISPVLAGGTPRAEFEILCGVPSLALFDSNEFNFMEKPGVACLPQILNEAGYHTIASNPFKPYFFNKERAYENLGFKETHFLSLYSHQEENLIMPLPEKGLPFDGDVFDANIELIKKRKLATPTQPILNYIMTVYGHTPFELLKSQKMIVQTEYEKISVLMRALSMSVYTTNALVKYIEQIYQISPEAIVLVIGDHLPAMPLGFKTYEKANYLPSLGRIKFFMTPRLLLFKNKPQKIDEEMMHHYDWFYCITEALETNVDEQCTVKPKSKESLQPLYESMMLKTIQ